MGGGERDMEESPKGKSPSTVVEVRKSGESREASKGKRLFISSIIGGTP